MATPRIVQSTVFITLIAIGVAGRWFQPTWCFTPLAAVSLFAGFYFSQRLAAFLVPLSVLGISDLLLPSYQQPEVMLAVYGVALAPVVLGRQMRENGLLPRLALYGLLPAILFWLTSNFAVWASQNMYPPTGAGLIACYTAALPFFRSMVTGDLMFTGLIFGCYLFATEPEKFGLGRWTGEST